jgi:DNA-binding transcriptional regulator LsrR (DeoR family)
MAHVDDLMRLTAARLYAEGYTGAQIAKHLGISGAKVAEIVKSAEFSNILKPQPSYRFVSKGIDRTTLRKLEQAVVDIDLQSRTQAAVDRFTAAQDAPICPTVRVVTTGSTRVDERGWTARLDRFGQGAAPVVREILRLSQRSVGISWGATVASVVRGIEQLRTGPIARNQSLTVVPLCGEPLGTPLSEESCTNLGARLDAAINRSKGHALSLSALPALIPIDAFSKQEELEVLRRLFRRVKHYRSIFETRGNGLPGWFDSLDTILCSVGPQDRVWGYRGDDLIDSGDLQRSELQTFVLGDLAGVLIPREGRWNEKKLTDIQAHYNGVSFDQLRACSARASASVDASRSNRLGSKARPMGVCALALGKNKARFVLECLRLRDRQRKPVAVVNWLIVDDDLATELLSMM